MRPQRMNSVSGRWTRAIPGALALLLVTGSALAVPVEAQLLAGSAKVSITPDPKTMPFVMGGYGDRYLKRTKTTGIRDTCYARALVLQGGAKKCALVSLDICFVPANVKRAVMERIGETGIPESALFLSATHSHTAPDGLLLHEGNTMDAGALPLFDKKVYEFIVDRIAQAIRKAAARLAAAKLGSGQEEGIGLNRNRRGMKLTDDQMTALKITDAAGKPIAAVFNYAAHPTYYGGDMAEVSGDWCGTFARQMEALMPDSVVLFINGAEGDASPNGADEGTPAEKIDTYAAKFAAKAWMLFESIQATPDAKIEGWTQECPLPECSPHPLYLTLASLGFGVKPDEAHKLTKRLMPARTEISFLRIGDVLLIGMPGEPTAEVGLAAKGLARGKGWKQPAVVALTNGWLGYLVSAEQYRAGQYEAQMSFYGEKIGESILQGTTNGLSRVSP